MAQLAVTVGSCQPECDLQLVRGAAGAPDPTSKHASPPDETTQPTIRQSRRPKIKKQKSGDKSTYQRASAEESASTGLDSGPSIDEATILETAPASSNTPGAVTTTKQPVSVGAMASRKLANKYNLGQEPSDYVKADGFDVVGKHALSHIIGKPAARRTDEKDGKVESQIDIPLDDKDFEKRWQRMNRTDVTCDEVMKISNFESRIDNYKGLAILPGEKELISVPVAAMKNAPLSGSARGNWVAGDGAVVLSETPDKKVKLAFFMITENRSGSATEKFKEQGSDEAVFQSVQAVYEAVRIQETFFGCSMVEGNFFHVDVAAFDKAVAKTTFAGDTKTKLKVEDPCCKDCNCMECYNCCVGFSCCCMECCDCTRRGYTIHGEWNAGFEEDTEIPRMIEMKVEGESDIVTHEFPGVKAMTFPEEQARLLELSRYVNINYRNSKTNEIQTCQLLVQPQVTMDVVCKFVGMLSQHLVALPDGKSRSGLSEVSSSSPLSSMPAMVEMSSKPKKERRGWRSYQCKCLPLC